MRPYLTLILVTLACSDDSSPFQDVERDPAFPGTPGEASVYQDWFDYEPVAGCGIETGVDLGSEVELRVFRGDGVSQSQVENHLGGLERYWNDFGLGFFARHEVIHVPLSHGVIVDQGDLESFIQEETGLNPNTQLTAEEEERVIEAAVQGVLYNVRQFIEAYGSPARNEIHVVLLQQMVAPGLFGAGVEFDGLVGLGFSPRLLSAVVDDDPLFDLFRLLGVPEEFTPTAFVGVDTVDEFLNVPDAVIAHEIGHALGLPHTFIDGNLMRQGIADCALDLTEEQIAIVEEETERLAHLRYRSSLLAQMSLSDRLGALRGSLRQMFFP